MTREELITNAILDKYGSQINVYYSSDILIAAGITEAQAEKLLEQLKQHISDSIFTPSE